MDRDAADRVNNVIFLPTGGVFCENPVLIFSPRPVS
jgi:hypothetical protein